MKVIQVTQFFNIEGMTWNEISKCDEKGVLPDTTGSTYLWEETPKIKEVKEDEEPMIGMVWYIKGPKNTIKRFKANYDTSD